jgi:hypothetical protein
MQPGGPVYGYFHHAAYRQPFLGAEKDSAAADVYRMTCSAGLLHPAMQHFVPDFLYQREPCGRPPLRQASPQIA